MKKKQSARSSRRQPRKSAKSRKVAKPKEKVVIEQALPVMPVEEKKPPKEIKVRKRISRSSGRYLQKDRDERLAKSYEHALRGPLCKSAPRAFVEDHNKGAIDSAWLDRGVDLDQLRHDHLVESPYRGKIFEKSNPDQTAIPFELSTCECEEGETCEVCLAQADVEAIPSCHINKKTELPPVNGVQQFKVVLPTSVAQVLDQAVG